MPKLPTENVLNRYRSVTYNFTLSALKGDDLKKPKNFQKSASNFVILKSSGKTKGFNASATEPIKTNIGATKVDDDGNLLTMLDSASQKSLVQSYNENSAGRFDMFIDSVEVETMMTPTAETGMALATKIKFDVIEPYSLNGFIDALSVAAKAAGHANHMVALYMLKVEFKGYSDSESGPSGKPKDVEFASRYFPIRITGVEISVNENGTKYSCTAVPYNEMGLSVPNKIIADIQMTGKTVGEILKNMVSSLNSKIDERYEQEKDSEKKKDRDRYEIYLPVFPDPGKDYTSDSIKTAKKNIIYDKPINKILSENNVFKFPKPTEGDYGTKKDQSNAQAAASDPNLTEEQKAALLKEQQSRTREYNPDKVSIMFSGGANVHEIIAAVIRDSEYLKDILTDVEKAKDKNGMIDYFKVHVNAVPEAFDAEKGVRIHTYQFIVTPYKIHYTRLPGQKFTSWPASQLDTMVKRTYNYIYTGENIDVLGFNIKFNNLYFQSANPKMGNANSEGAALAVSAPNDNKITLPSGAGISGSENGNTPAPPMEIDADANSQDGRAGARRTDPYYMLAYNAHKTILESVDLIKGDLDILGDPYYLVTGGMGNYIPPIQDNAITLDGEANIQGAEPYVKLNFRNPVDFNYQTGLMEFDTVADYSGIYRVIKCRSTFRDGLFKQQLNILRLPGQQEVSQRKRPSKSYDFIEKPKAGSVTVADSAPLDVTRYGLKPNEFNLAGLINKGLPTTGVPGFMSNLQSQGGIIGSIAGGASAVAGVIQSGVSALGRASGIVGANLLPGISSTIDRIAVGSRLGANGLQTVAGLTNKVTGASANGITMPTVNADTVMNGVSNISNAVRSGADSLVNNALSRINSLQSGGASAALANTLGVNASQITGLSSNLTGNTMNQLRSIAGNIPASVDLGEFKQNGLILGNLTSNALKNLPASFPKSVAPDAAIEMSDSLGSTKYMELLAKEIKAKSEGVTSSLPVPTVDQVSGNFTPSFVTDPQTGNLIKNYSADAVDRMKQSSSGLEAKLNDILGYATTKADDIANNAKSMATSALTQAEQATEKLRGMSVDELKTKLTGVGSSMGFDTDTLLSAKSLPNLSAMAGSVQSLSNPLTQLSGISLTPSSALLNPSAALGQIRGSAANVTDVAARFAPSTGSSPLDTLLRSKGIINARV